MNMHGLDRFQYGLNMVIIKIVFLTIFRIGWTTLNISYMLFVDNKLGGPHNKISHRK